MVLNYPEIIPQMPYAQGMCVRFSGERSPLGFISSSKGFMSFGEKGRLSQELKTPRNAPCAPPPSPEAACPTLDNAERGKIINQLLPAHILSHHVF